MSIRALAMLVVLALSGCGAAQSENTVVEPEQAAAEEPATDRTPCRITETHAGTTREVPLAGGAWSPGHAPYLTEAEAMERDSEGTRHQPEAGYEEFTITIDGHPHTYSWNPGTSLLDAAVVVADGERYDYSYEWECSEPAE